MSIFDVLTWAGYDNAVSTMNLFRKAKLAVKFRKAGEGHVLSESSSSQAKNQPNVPQQPRKAPTSDAQRAGQVQIMF